MTNDKEQGGEPLNKESVKRFVIRITKPFELETQGLGRVLARRMTVQGSSAFFKRLKSLDGVPDAELARIYMGSVSGLPLDDPEKLPEPLTEEQVARLTDEDVAAFASAYLSHIVNATEAVSPISQLADFIRRERSQSIQDQKKLAETIGSALRVSSTSEMMKQWRELNQSITGPIDSLRVEMARVLGPVNAMRSPIGDALKDLHRDRLDAMRSSIGDALKDLQRDRLDAIKKASGFLDKLHPSSEPLRTYEPLVRLQSLPPIEETPIGRTAIAVEKLSKAGKRMEIAMNLVVEQAGNVSEQMGQVLEKIEAEAGKSQKTARLALRIGGLSLLVSAVALGTSAIFSWLGYRADREDAKNGDPGTAQVVRELQGQNAALRSVLAELRSQRKAAASLQPNQVAAPNAAESKQPPSETPREGKSGS